MRGFTVTETVVAIVMSALLVGVISVAASRARRQTASMACVHNLRDFSNVFAICASDHNNRLFTPRNWAEISRTPYDPETDSGRSPFVDYWDTDLENAFSTHLRKRACPCQPPGTGPTGNSLPGYMMSRLLSKPPHYRMMHLNEVYKAANKIIFIDGQPGCPHGIRHISDVEKWVAPAAKVHGGKVNVIYADMHVGSVSPKDLEENWNEMMLP